jgi:hypothetical protein
MEEIEITKNGIHYSATYELIDDHLVVRLPDNSIRQTELRAYRRNMRLWHIRAFANHCSTKQGTHMNDNKHSISLSELGERSESPLAVSINGNCRKDWLYERPINCQN